MKLSETFCACFHIPRASPQKFSWGYSYFCGTGDWTKAKKGVIFSAPTWPSTKLDKKRQFEKKEVIGLFPFFQLKLKSASFSFRACLLQSASSNWRSQKMRKKIKSGFCHFFSHIIKTFLFLRNVQIFLYPHVDYQLNVSKIKKYSKSEHVQVLQYWFPWRVKSTGHPVYGHKLSCSFS